MHKLTRREFAKLSKIIAIALCVTLVACGIEDVLAGINVAISVLTAAAGITGLNPAIAADLGKVNKILADITSGYDDYEKAEASLKPGKLATLEAAIGTAQADLGKILNDAGVNEPSYLRTAIAVANSAIIALINKLGAPSKARISLKHGFAKPLPTISNAKSANDLKKAWNDAVKAEHPEAVIQ